MDAYVWQTIEELAHQPNEYCVIDNLVNDAKVYATVLAALCCGSQFKA
jgi:succinyl-diaminopimelate desuccinylase